MGREEAVDKRRGLAKLSEETVAEEEERSKEQVKQGKSRRGKEELAVGWRVVFGGQETGRNALHKEASPAGGAKPWMV